MQTIWTLDQNFSGVTTRQQLMAAISAIAAEAGFCQWRIGLVVQQQLHRPEVVTLSDCCHDWAVLYEQQQLARIDPILHLAVRQTKPILWNALSQRRDLPIGSRQVMGMAAEHGLRDGLTFVVHRANVCGVISFISDDDLGVLPHAHLLRVAADYAIDAAIRITRAGRQRKKLTPREGECLSLISDGGTVEAVARRLDITPRTVHYHVQQAINKLGAATRDQAIAIATREGLLQPDLTAAQIVGVEW